MSDGGTAVPKDGCSCQDHALPCRTRAHTSHTTRRAHTEHTPDTPDTHACTHLVGQQCSHSLLSSREGCCCASARTDGVRYTAQGCGWATRARHGLVVRIATAHESEGGPPLRVVDIVPICFASFGTHGSEGRSGGDGSRVVNPRDSDVVYGLRWSPIWVAIPGGGVLRGGARVGDGVRGRLEVARQRRGRGSVTRRPTERINAPALGNVIGRWTQFGPTDAEHERGRESGARMAVSARTALDDRRLPGAIRVRRSRTGASCDGKKCRCSLRPFEFDSLGLSLG